MFAILWSLRVEQILEGSGHGAAIAPRHRPSAGRSCTLVPRRLYLKEAAVFVELSKLFKAVSLNRYRGGRLVRKHGCSAYCSVNVVHTNRLFVQMK